MYSLHATHAIHTNQWWWRCLRSRASAIQLFRLATGSSWLSPGRSRLLSGCS